MATRVIVATKPSNAAVNHYTGGSCVFSVDSDTGPVTGSFVDSATLHMAAMKNDESGQYFQVKYGSSSGDVLAMTSELPLFEGYAEATLTLASVQEALLTDEPSAICLTLQSWVVDASSNVSIQPGSQITLTITYASRCGTPGNVRLSTTQSSGGAMLQWNAAADGDGNAVSYYEVVRETSKDGGSTWTGWETVGTTTGLYKWVSAPATEGDMYRFCVRAVGTAGESYASYWVQSSNTLTKVLPKLNEYTDPVITAGVTKVKAAHITELQTNVNIVRSAYNWTTYTFTAVTAQYTSLGDWNAHIEELRDAIDDVNSSHETWLTLGDNCPRADVLEQLRRVVEAVAG